MGFGQVVIGMCDEANGLNEQIDGNGGIQTEGFIRDNAYIGHMFGEIVGNLRDKGIFPHKDGHL